MRLILSFVLILISVPAPAGEPYLLGALGYSIASETECRCEFEVTESNRPVAKLAGGYQFANGIFLEAEHISDPTIKDQGVNAAWIGYRVNPFR